MRHVLRAEATLILALMLLSPAQPAVAATVAVTRGPYLQQGAPNTVVVRWRTDLATASLVRFGTAPGGFSGQAGDATPVTEHIVAINGLQPNTKYYYELGTSSAWFPGDVNDFFTTAPLIGTRKPTRIWVLGDSGNANATAAAVASAYAAYTGSRPTDVWLMLGDNAYDDGSDAEYPAAVFNMYPTFLQNSFLWPTIGNHDAHLEDAAGHFPYFDIFTLTTQAEAGGVPSGTEHYYSFDYANIHFICLDSMTSSRAVNSPMAVWLRADLAATTQDWLIAFWHHPPYSHGTHNSDTESELIEMRQTFVPILESYGVDLVLGGHSHSYERSFLIDGHYGSSSTFTPSMKKNGGSGRENDTGAYLKPAGLAGRAGAVYTVAGCGSGGGGANSHPAMFVSGGNPGSLVIDITTNRLDLVFLTQSGTVGDYFTMLKPLPVPPNPPAAPTNLVATAVDATTINLSWSNTSSETAGFRVERSTNGVDFTLLSIVSASVTNGSDNGLSPSTTYYYRVLASNAAGDSPYSEIAQASTFPPAPDVTPPAAVTNLFTSGVTSNSVTLLWTAPGDDGNSGTAARYDVRVHTEYITETNWDTATPVSGAPFPAAAGSAQGIALGGLAPGTLYYFALKTSDETNNVSPLSNIAEARTPEPVPPDSTPPAAVSDLRITSVATNSVTLAWAAPGDDGRAGTASRYDLRLSTGPITEANWAAATPVPGLPAPLPAGSTQTVSLAGLGAGTSYYFALKTADEINNTSPLSNVPFTTTRGLPPPWRNTEVGSVGLRGAATHTNGVFTIKGAGSDIGGTADSFHYVYQSASGDCEIIARVNGLQNTSSSAKAGVMIRESTNRNSRLAMLALTPGKKVVWLRRTSTGGSVATTTASGSNWLPPVWLRVTRTNNTFSAWHSTNGVSWIASPPKTFTMGSNFLIGLGVTSKTTSKLNTATFDHVTASP